MRLEELATPSAVVDLDVVERNCAVMSERAARLGVRLRPHVKTHKCVEAARLQVAGHFGGITVSTLAEARFFADAGFDDITYAVPISPARIPDALALAQRISLHLLVDHRDMVSRLARAAGDAEQTVSVFLKVDCGYHRAGVEPSSPEALPIVEALVAAPSLRFAGLLTHGGHSYACRDRAGIEAVAVQERDVIVGFAETLQARGIEVPEVSLGSTPTLSLATDLTGVTEVRPGNYVFYDAFQARIGSCSLEDAAFSVLASVIGRHADRAVIDAGALALSKDAGATHVMPDAGFGVLTRLDGAPLPGLTLRSLSQEHGLIDGDRVALAPLDVGTRVRIIANHSCLAAALHSTFHVARGDDVVARWAPTRGW